MTYFYLFYFWISVKWELFRYSSCYWRAPYLHHQVRQVKAARIKPKILRPREALVSLMRGLVALGTH